MAAVRSSSDAAVVAHHELPRGSRRATIAFWVAFTAALAPFLAALVSLIGSHWHASSDDAVEVLGIKDVGGRHTPLIGPLSRLGAHNWHHPGPLLFWTLAPFRWLAGDTGILAGVLIINAVAVAGAVWVARRRGGVTLAAIAAIAILLLVRALGVGVVADPWNPWVAVLPALTYLLLAWSLAERDFAMLPWLAVAGSLAVQSEVAYVPLVAGAAAVAIALACVRRRGEAPLDRTALRRGVIFGVIAAVALWLAPLIQQFTGHPGNLGEIISYFRHPTEPALGFRTAYGIMGRELPFTWLRGNDTSVLGFVIPDRTLPALVLLTMTAIAGALAWRRRRAGATRFAIFMLALSGIGVIATARVTGVAGSYLLRWWWVIGALICCSIAWSLACLINEDTRARVVGTVATIAAAVLAVFVVSDVLPTRVPDQAFSRAIGKLAPATAEHLTREHRYLLSGIDAANFGDPVGNGLFLDLDERGYRVYVSADHAPAFGSWRAARPGETDGSITVVSSDDLATFRTPPGATQVARYDPLTTAQRERASALEAAIRDRVGELRVNDVDGELGRVSLVHRGAQPRDIDELAALRRRGRGYVVFVSR